MALLLVGTTEGVILPGPVTVTKNRAALTGMAWVRYDLHPAANAKVFGYSLGNNAVNSRFTMVTRGSAPGQLQVGGRALDADPQRTLDSTTALPLGVWLHVAGIIDYTNAVGFIYINGELDISGALSGLFGAAQTENTDSLSAGIGVREGGAGQQGIDGNIEDFRLYDGILGPSAIKTIYTGEGKDGIVEGLLHRYPLTDQGPGVAVVTATNVAAAERLVGTPLGAPTFAAGRIVGRKRARATGRRV